MKPIIRLSAVLLLILTSACEREAELPATASEAYAEAVADFYAGIAALQAGEAGLAESSFSRVTELAPGEPGGWANLALTALARRQPDAASTAIGRALELAPDHPRLNLIAALVARDRGRTDAALSHLRTAVGPDSANIRAVFLLAQLLERQGGPESLDEAGRLLDRILASSPGNLLALLERARLAALGGASREVLDALDRLEEEAGVRAAAEQQVQAVREAVATESPERTATAIARLETRLQPLGLYRDNRDALRIAAGGADVMLTSFVRLPVPPARSAAPDLDVAFVPESLSVGEGPWDWVRGLWLGEEIPVALIAANSRQIGIGVSLDRVELFEFPGGGSPAQLPAAALAFLDYDYDFAVDLAFAGPGGIRLIRQASIGTFVDVTDQAIPAPVSDGDYAGVWAADLDMEGDMDLVLARTNGEPLVLWNQGDDRFEPGTEFVGVRALRELAWADLDADGDPDAALIDATGRLHVYINRRFRTPRFEPRPIPDSLGDARAVAVADLDRDGVLELVLLQADGTVRRVSVAEGGEWSSTVLTQWPEFDAPDVGYARLFLPDLDNNGDLDLLVSDNTAAEAWLTTPEGPRPQQSVEARVTDVADLSGEGRLDLVGVGPSGTPSLFTNEGGQDYYSTTLSPRAARALGDRRINSFGIGGEIEIRAGVLYQKQPISAQTVHFGMGEHAELDVARITWPNGTVQAEFGVPATNEAVTALQRLKGSCPWVFAHDGSGVQFVTDFLWRTALGLRINAQGDASVIHAEDWIRIRGDQLASRNGLYDVRITGELWESHFFDHVSLLAVDHPERTEVFVDERFTLPAPVPAVHVVGRLRPVESARDQDGRDVSDLVAELDERYLDTFELGPYQGLAEEHHVEVDLGEAADTTGPLWLVASGWVYPTDGSINFALAQAGRAGPRGLRIEVPDGRGDWTVVEEDFGFPAGKTKTILIDLSDAFRPGTPRQVRLGTNMEVYWDRLAWAAGRADTARTVRLSASSATLRYRGFSAVRAASRRAPEIPDYDRIDAVTPIWRDLVGFHTRFGDVRPLIEEVDDRYVIMNAGDELALRFPAPPPPPDGWVRDFVLIGDGWVKDGDFNNGFSRTLMPLPYHGLEDYDRSPRRLEDDPAYRRHPDDWRVYHTRYVTPEPFQRALVPRQADPAAAALPARSEAAAGRARP
jgi:Tfp pilus assembly protein PilF